MPTRTWWPAWRWRCSGLAASSGSLTRCAVALAGCEEGGRQDALGAGHARCVLDPALPVERGLPGAHHPRIKVSRADLLGELRRPAKSAAYRALCGQCWFVLRPASPRLEESRPSFGVLFMQDGGLTLARRRPGAHRLDFATLMALARAAPERRRWMTARRRYDAASTPAVTRPAPLRPGPGLRCRARSLRMLEPRLDQAQRDSIAAVFQDCLCLRCRARFRRGVGSASWAPRSRPT